VAVSELELYRQQFSRIQQQASELIAGLDEARFNWRPFAQGWSIEECLAHLIIVGQWEIGAIEAVIDKARKRGLTGHGPFQYSAIDRFLVDQTEPPVRSPLPAPRRFAPLHGQPVTAVMPTFLHLQSQLILLLERAEGLDLRRVKVATPILPVLKMSLGMMFAQIAAHERRHLQQAKRVREKL
jgi:hypothetical protein